MDDLFARILNLTSYLESQIIHFIDDFFYQSVHRCSEELPFICSQEALTPSSYKSACDGSSSSSKYFIADSEICTGSTNAVEELSTDTRTCTQTNRNHSLPLVLLGLKLQLYGLRVIRRVALAYWRYVVCCAKRIKVHLSSTISRAKTSLRGSSDEIGWLQNYPGMAPVEDGTARFMELLQGIRNGQHTLPDSFVYLLIPGLFSNHAPLYFVTTKKFFCKMGLACHIARIHSEASVEHNARELKHYIEELYWGSGKRVMLLGHSKGGVDAAAASSLYWTELKGKVAGLALVQSPYGGSPIVSDFLREGQLADMETRRIMELIICKLIKGDLRAMEDLTYKRRREFILTHNLPNEIPLISFHSEANIAPSILMTLNHIAHAELPWIPFPRPTPDHPDDFIHMAPRVPVVVPMSGVMAICALHLLLRYGERSDGVVTCRDAEVPGSVVIRPDKKLDHAWLVYSSWRKNVNEPDCSEMCEAILTLLVEIEKQKDVGSRNPE